ncbi:MAG: HNH endonuclease [Clostridia bacterium]
MLKTCLHPNCRKLATVRVYCAEHAVLHPAADYSGDRRPSVYQREGYGSGWRQARDRQLQAFPKCQRCGAPAVAVHHILPVLQGGTHASDNLVSLCDSCHMIVEPRGGRGVKSQGPSAHTHKRLSNFFARPQCEAPDGR